jgi:hypothetical protein
VLNGKFARLWAWNRLPLNTYISMHAKRNRCYDERGSRTNYVRSRVPHCICDCIPNLKQNWNVSGQIIILIA